MGIFFLSSFFRTTRPLASSEATAYYRPAPGRTDSIPERHQRQWIWIRLYKFLAGMCQRNRSWIKGLGKNPQKSELIHWRQCLLSGTTEQCPRHHAHVTATCGVLTWLPAKLAKNEMRVKTSADWRLNKNVGFKRHPVVKWVYAWDIV